LTSTLHATSVTPEPIGMFSDAGSASFVRTLGMLMKPPPVVPFPKKVAPKASVASPRPTACLARAMGL
jgi:hypothetical protein